MLTRLEVDGFKNLLDFTCDFGPYTCIAGPNAVGKSNVFDAIEFLSLLADLPFLEAAQRLRSIGTRGADPRTLFWTPESGKAARITLAAEMIVPAQIVDDFGRLVTPTTTFLRYELVLEYRLSPTAGYSRGGIMLVSESLRHIKKGDASNHLPWPHSEAEFRDSVLLGRRAGTAYISTTETDEGEWSVNVHQDGGSRGQPRRSPAALAPRTVVSTTTTADDPTILAARREMQSWRMLALEPSAMRTPDSLVDPTQVAVNGGHLAAALNRMSTEQGPYVFAKVAASASALAGVREVGVDLDPARELLTLEARLGDGPMLPARSLSDGTLRFLALCILSTDDSVEGLLCMEEPENGIHPGRMSAMQELVSGLAVDPEERPGPGNPFRQVMVNTHSPHYVQYTEADDLLLAMPTSVLREGRVRSTVTFAPLAGTWRTTSGGPSVSEQTIREYLTNPSDAILKLAPAIEEVAV